MDIEDKSPSKINEEQEIESYVSTSTSLDDEQRIKVLSPTMLVLKRFIRNKLAIVGVIFIGLMFVFSFIGGWLSPYKEAQVFTEYVDMPKAYAGVTYNRELRFTSVEGFEFPLIARSKFILAINNNQTTFEAQDESYSIDYLGKDYYLVNQMKKVSRANTVMKETVIEIIDNAQVGNDFVTDFKNALTAEEASFESGGKTFYITKDKKSFYANDLIKLSLASLDYVDFANAESKTDFEFSYQAGLAILSGASNFTSHGIEYEIESDDEVAVVYETKNGQKTLYANISKYIVQSLYIDAFLSIDFKTSLKEAINDNLTEFTWPNEDGTEQRYELLRNNFEWTLKRIESTHVIQAYSFPSSNHLLGTDANGMDILTRMMYGGRISLMIGFIVVVIETFLGVVLGGIAGYFGKWIDNLLMRVVDIFNCIPSLPLLIIIGAMMDSMKVDPSIRMIYLMLILGFLGWPGIARLVRGQILSLREQEFMVAAEATGISVYRRIFKHLVPNVIPQLIVVSTMSLGSVILTESVLSFLGLGVKYPFASWGNIMNAVSNVHVMTNYWFVWIPAGFCVLITVLGFNFIGDGLRDAFDPKMKR
jgi:peptide/nickel transport system permease protein